MIKIILEIKRRTLIIAVLCLCTSTFVFSQNTGGLLSGGSLVCAGNNAGFLNLTSFNGTIKRWETANSPSGPWSAMTYTLPNYNYINLNQSIWFRVVTQVLNFSENFSNAEQIICQSGGQVPIIAAPNQLCPSTPATASVIAGSAVNVVWEYSNTNWQTSSTFGAGSTTVVSLNVLTPPYQIRMISADGICPALISNTRSVGAASATSAGFIAGTNSVCSSSNSFSLSINNPIGAVLFWESSTANTGPFFPVNGSAGLLTFPIANLSQTSFYKALVQNEGCSMLSTIIHTVNVQSPSVAGFITGTSSLCTGPNSGSLILLGHTGNSILWQRSADAGLSWNNAANSGTILPLLNVNSTGLYRTVVQNGICPSASSNSHTFTINSLPLPAFNFSNVCSGTTITFTNQSQNTSTQVFKFGEGNYSFFFSPSHIYNTAGTYTVSLLCTSVKGCQDSLSKVISIHPLPVVSLFSGSAACMGANLQFASTATISTGSILTNTFNFNDGTPWVNAAITTHSFATSGIHNISLSVLSNNACLSTITKTLLIHPKPSAAFRVANTCQETQLNLKDDSQLNGASLSYQWLFGNGDTSVSALPNYKYPQSGNYLIKLTLNSDKGCSDTKINSVRIHPIITGSINPLSACANNALLLSAIVSDTSALKKAELNFGDGSSSGSWHAQHTFNQAGNYTLQLQLESDSGCLFSTTAAVVIHPRPVSFFSSNPACQNTALSLKNYSSISSGSINCSWSLQAPLSGTVGNYEDLQPSIIIANAGTYSLQLFVRSDNNCRDSSMISIKVNAVPIVEFNAEIRCQSQSGFFQNKSTINESAISRCEWNFGDFSFATAWQTQKKYDKAGIYTVTLKCSSNEECSAMATKTLQIFPLAVATFSNGVYCEGYSKKLLNTSRNIEGSFSSQWQLSSLEIYSTSDLDIQALKPGRHDIKLINTTDAGCRDSIQQTLFIYPLPDLKLRADTLIALGQEIILNASGAASYTWFPDRYLSSPTSANPFCKPDSSLHYFCFGLSEQGCLVTKEIHIQVRKDYQLKIYNLITPDGNGLNDTWQIDNISSYPDNHVLLFDQWNNIIFEQKNYQNNWDGKNKRGELLPPGTYFYQISFETSALRYRGYLSLLLIN